MEDVHLKSSQLEADLALAVRMVAAMQHLALQGSLQQGEQIDRMLCSCMKNKILAPGELLLVNTTNRLCVQL